MKLSYYQRNKLKWKIYFKKNKAIIYQRTKDWRKRNKRKVRDYAKKYRELYKDKNNARRKKYIKTPNHIYYKLLESAKLRNLDVGFTKNTFVKWYKQQNKKCIYCNRDIKTIHKQNLFAIDKRFSRLSVDRLNNIKNYSLKNIGLACFSCNRIKGSLFTFNEMKIIGNFISKKRGTKC